MSRKIFFSFFSVLFFFQISFAQLCAALKDVRAGEYHTLVLDENNDLWVCGSGGDAIDTSSNQAAWLTDQFVVPNFYTNTPFDFTVPEAQAFGVSNNSSNPVWDFNQPSDPPYSRYQYDTGWSKIDDDKLEITIHYEVVDLGENGWSPLSFTDVNGTDYVKSERYVMLQTYVFKNIDATEDINNLEFYQMLHGYGTIFVAI